MCHTDGPLETAASGRKTVRADDNWLIGSWKTAEGAVYTFASNSVSVGGSSGAIGPFKATYDVADDKIVVHADQLADATATKENSTHCKFKPGSADALELIKQ